jgi:hypothetical protein
VTKYLPAIAGAIKSWTASETVRSTDLNSNFTHIHTAAEELVSTAKLADSAVTNVKVSASAAIAHSKLATPALVPKAYASLAASCAGAGAAGTVCGSQESSQLTLQADSGAAGRYRGVLGYTPANTNFLVLVTTTNSSTGARCSAHTLATASPHFKVYCYDNAEAAADVAFSVLVMDQ